ncbi:AI-2E family transporter [Desulfoferrobacter suflitae]|uniref:AI-2E family transporter n=1 Tax=Desulfoferrobacter suflitae TaxID=2865782 RepID=UPI0021643FF1|nr:AI-2E family transporter [Desulfoferrobacter suflitae]MCK8602366.1 AI-2E family transporter [Desulfoferrobacter suflitae]
MHLISNWFRRQLSDPQVVILVVLLMIGVTSFLILGNMLAPVLASAVIAYLLEGLVSFMERWKIPRIIAVLIVFLIFMTFLVFLLFGLLPLLWQQIGQLFQQLPAMISWTQQELMRLPERYPGYISEQQVVDLINVIRSELTSLGQRILSLSVSSVPSVISIVVYIFLMPLLVFFFLKDKDRLVGWVTGFLPEDRRLASEVWQEVDLQIGNYVRGKVWEIFIVWGVSYITFAVLGLDFAILISLSVGLSVLVPYIGAAVMGLPVVLIGYFQWGWSSQLAYAGGAYLVIQLLDGNLLAPLLLSEVVNLHPIAIIVAILVFGGMWGFWGVFFAIPLATLVQALLKALSSQARKNGQTQHEDDPNNTGARPMAFGGGAE